MRTQIYVIIGIFLIGILTACEKEEAKQGPDAAFTVNPAKGYVDTEFEFDASGSTDAEDPVSALKVRWDWDGDGNWDTEFSKTKLYTHSYPEADNYMVKMEVMDTDGWTNKCYGVVSVMADTTPPLAAFSVTPNNGNTTTIFKFDATNTLDHNKIDDHVMIRWDWEGDGIWDTGYRKDPKAYHRYINPGNYTATMEVVNNNDLVNIAEISVHISH